MQTYGELIIATLVLIPVALIVIGNSKEILHPVEVVSDEDELNVS